MKYARIENNTVVEFIDFNPTGKFHPALFWVLVPVELESTIGYGWTWTEDGGFIPPPIPKVPAPTMNYAGAIQCRLDAFAQTRGYDGIVSAVSYAESTEPRYRAEGLYAIQARDSTWKAYYHLLAQVEAGTIAPLSLKELKSRLPVLEWEEAGA